MRNAVCFVLIFTCGGAGAFLLTGRGRDDRSQTWVRDHLEVIQDQLAGLKEHVLAYRKTHGRYPTNDEGLGVIDDFEVRIKACLYHRRSDSDEALPAGYSMRLRLWERYGEVISSYRLEAKSNPDWAKESPLQSLGIPNDPLDEQDMKSLDLEAVAVELAIGRGDNLFLLRDGVVLSPWWIPYVYENRNGCEEAAFSASPVNDAGSDKYSIKVDQGVYISSIGAMEQIEETDAQWCVEFRMRLIGGGLIVVALVALAVMIRGKAGIAGLIALVVSGAGGAGAHVTFERSTCYIMSPLFSRRTPAMVQRQKELLSKYRDAGMITEATYKRALDASQPTSAPAEP